MINGETVSVLKIRKEIECYDKIMELRPNYPKIWYNLGLGYNKRLKNMFIKVKISTKSEENKLKEEKYISAL